MLLGRAAGISEAKLAHLGDDLAPDGLYSDEETAIIRYARTSTLMQPIDDELYDALARHLEAAQVVELCFVVGLSNMVNRFHATFLTPLDDATKTVLAESCPVPLPEQPSR